MKVSTTKSLLLGVTALGVLASVTPVVATDVVAQKDWNHLEADSREFHHGQHGDRRKHHDGEHHGGKHGDGHHGGRHHGDGHHGGKHHEHRHHGDKHHGGRHHGDGHHGGKHHDGGHHEHRDHGDKHHGDGHHGGKHHNGGHPRWNHGGGKSLRGSVEGTHPHHTLEKWSQEEGVVDKPWKEHREHPAQERSHLHTGGAYVDPRSKSISSTPDDVLLLSLSENKASPAAESHGSIVSSSSSGAVVNGVAEGNEAKESQEILTLDGSKLNPELEIQDEAASTSASDKTNNKVFQQGALDRVFSLFARAAESND